MQYNNRIILLQQYHIPEDKDRLLEIQDTLKRNVQSGLFYKIYLLNEREYTKEELGFPQEIPSVIQQVIINERLDYFTAFEFARRCIKDSWVVLSNNDIFYDTTLRNLFIIGKRTRTRTTLRKKIYSKMICLLRWELEGDQPFLFNHPNYIMRSISQDSWMWYSQESPQPIPETKVLMGKPGCDNRIAFVLRNYFKYDLINCPFLIKSYHNHKSGIRYYSRDEKIQGPYNYIQPIL